MQNIAIKKANEIETPVRQWLQQLFGRSLNDEEQVSIFVGSGHSPPNATERHAAFERVNRVLDTAAGNMQQFPESEFDEAVDEAMQQIRKRSE